MPSINTHYYIKFKKMKKLSLLFATAFAITTFSVSAQINQTPVHGGQIYVAKEKEKAATGTMYLEENYMPAKVSNNDTPQLLRYNAYSDYFEVNNPQEQQVKVLPKQEGVTITFNGNGQTYAFVPYVAGEGDKHNGYLNVISSTPKVKIYKREHIYLQAGSISSNSYQTSKAPTYRKAKDEFYVQIGDEEAQYFSGKKDYAKLVPGKSKEVLDYIKKNSIDLDEATGLQKLADYTASIL